MTDNELLEAAVKAYQAPISDRCDDWNPLHDDGAALQLAVKLDMLFNPALSIIYSEVLAKLGCSDPPRVMRRAIVITAALLGSRDSTQRSRKRSKNC